MQSEHVFVRFTKRMNACSFTEPLRCAVSYGNVQPPLIFWQLHWLRLISFTPFTFVCLRTQTDSFCFYYSIRTLIISSKESKYTKACYRKYSASTLAFNSCHFLSRYVFSLMPKIYHTSAPNAHCIRAALFCVLNFKQMALEDLSREVVDSVGQFLAQEVKLCRSMRLRTG